jgi:hypothetical protein
MAKSDPLQVRVAEAGSKDFYIYKVLERTRGQDLVELRQFETSDIIAYEPAYPD